MRHQGPGALAVRAAWIAGALIVGPGLRFDADAGVLRSAAVRILQLDAGTCEVSMTVGYDEAAGEIEHLLAAPAAYSVSGVEVTRAGHDGPVDGLFARSVRAGHDTVHTLNVPIGAAAAGGYLLAYHVSRAPGESFGCPIWVPRLATDGGSLRVRLEVVLPAGAHALPDAFPVLRWSGRRGEVELAHLPTVVRAPFTIGERVSWSRRVGWRRLLDAATLLTLAMATAAWWAWRRAR